MILAELGLFREKSDSLRKNKLSVLHIDRDYKNESVCKNDYFCNASKFSNVIRNIGFQRYLLIPYLMPTSLVAV